MCEFHGDGPEGGVVLGLIWDAEGPGALENFPAYGPAVL